MKLADLRHGVVGVFRLRASLRRLEREVRDYFGVRYVFLMSSGKSALALILRALQRLSDRHQVVIPAYTCFSLPAAVVRAGLGVRLADVDPETFDFDHRSLQAAIGPETLGVVLNHLFGIAADVARVRELCEPRGVFVIEDAAQAMGARVGRQLLGSVADVGFFSLGRGKNITAGSGGIAVTNCDRIGEALAAEYRTISTRSVAEMFRELLRVALMSVFIRPSLYWLPANLPFLGLGETRYEPDFPMRRLSGVGAAILRRWPERLQAANEARAQAGAYYASHLPGSWRPGVPYLRMPVLMPSRAARDRAYARAAREGLGVSLLYPTPIDEIAALKGGFNGQRFPAAKMMAERLLTLPTHHWVTERDRAAICQVLTDANGAAA